MYVCLALPLKTSLLVVPLAKPNPLESYPYLISVTFPSLSVVAEKYSSPLPSGLFNALSAVWATAAASNSSTVTPVSAANFSSLANTVLFCSGDSLVKSNLPLVAVAILARAVPALMLVCVVNAS